MENNQKFIEKVSGLFLEYGAKSVTMDDIAKELGISKKTLYQKYKNKEAILEEVLTVSLDEVLIRMKSLDHTIKNPIQKMLARDEYLDKASRTNDSLFLRQLMKYYPHIFDKHMLNFSEKLSDILVNNIKNGREQGLYRKDFNAQLYSKLFFQLIITFDNTSYLYKDEISRLEFRCEALLFYLNSITTEKGKECLKDLQNHCQDY